MLRSLSPLDTLPFQTLLNINVVYAVISAFCVTRHTCNFLLFAQKLNTMQCALSIMQFPGSVQHSQHRV